MIPTVSRVCAMLLALCVTLPTAAQSPNPQTRTLFVQRSIADITAFLDKDKPDPAKRAQNEAMAASAPPEKADRAALKDFYFKRAQAKAALGRAVEAAEDSDKAAGYISDYVKDGPLIEFFTEQQWRNAGEYKKAIAI